jgi:uncharacterized protein YigA (DUF484 family)
MTERTIDGLTAPDVAAYLAQHPHFLSDYPALAASLVLPREHGPTASLAVYQIQHLRERNAELERRLTELASIAADNEKLMQRVHSLTVALLRATSFETTARSVVARLGEDFHTEQVRLLLFGPPQWHAAEWLLHEPGGPAALPQFGDFLQRQEPISGRLSRDKLSRLFGDQAKQIRSAAMVPLGEVGILAIGSDDPDRFQPGMGTLFLNMIGATVSAALLRAQAAG